MRFLTSICIAAVCIALFKLLIPENKFSKQISLLCVCIFLLTGISAVSGAEINLNSDQYELGTDENFIGFSEVTEEELRNRICTEMRDKIRTLLAENEIFPEEIHIIVNISGLYGIDISQVKLVFNAEEQAAAEAAADMLTRELCGDIEINVEVKE